MQRLWRCARAARGRARRAFQLLLLLPAAPLLLACGVHAQGAGPGCEADTRERIREQLIHAYAYAWDARDCAAWAALFAADARLDLGTSMRAEGREAIREGCVARQAGVLAGVRTRHYVTNTVFDELGDSVARTRSYVMLTWQRAGEASPTVIGGATYRDVLVRQPDGRWLFQERVVIEDPALR